MKKLNSWLLAVALIICTVLAGCGGGGSSEETKTVKVTYDLNYEGAPASTVKEIEKDDVPPQIADPSREGYQFGGWFTETGCADNKKVDWEYAISEDTVFYAKWTQVSAAVTFSDNYEGGKDTVVNATIGGTVSQPEDPKRDGHLFTNWYADASCTQLFDFTAAITGDVTIYAGWEESSGDTVKVVFDYNYEGAGEYYATTIKNGRRVAEPAAPSRDSFAFIGWYTTPECTEPFNFSSFISDNVTLYALWYNIYTFEAEYCDVDDVSGSGLSVEVSGREIIDKDIYNAGASNGYYVSYLYKNGCELEFNINAESEVENAWIVLRITAEVQDMVIKSDEYAVIVNGEKLTYPDLSITEVPEFNSGKKRPFENFVIAKNVHLNQGANVISLLTDNSKAVQGTMYATAPMVDCIYLYSNVTLDWVEGKCYSDNMVNLPDD